MGTLRLAEGLWVQLLILLSHGVPPAADNKFAKFLLSCLKCCFWCLEKFIKFLNRNAYIMVRVCQRWAPKGSWLWGVSAYAGLSLGGC